MKFLILFLVFVCAQATRRRFFLRRFRGPHNATLVRIPVDTYARKAGSNMCAVEYVPHLGRTFYTDSPNWSHRNVCGYSTQVQYECCEGYTSAYGSADCSVLLALKDVLKTTSSMGAGLFVDYLRRTPSALDVLKRTANEGSVTIFAPSDEAIRSLTTEKRYAFESNLHRNLLYHVISKRVYMEDLPEGDSDFKTLDGYYTPLKITRFSNQINTVNCHLVTRRDHRATNGVVHVIDAVLDPPETQATTLLNVLSNDHRFSDLYRLVSGIPDVIELLRDSHRTLTVMAPTNEAFAALNPTEYSRIQRDHTLIKQLLQLHIVPQSMCSPAVVERQSVRTVGGAKITIGCDGTGVTVNGQESRFLQDYRFATNGFLSAVNKVLVPKPVKTVWDLMDRDNLSLFADLVRRYGLEQYLKDSTVTVFAPDNEAIRSWARLDLSGINDHLLSLLVSRDFVYNHLVYGKSIATSEFVDGKAEYSLERYSSIRMKVARKWYGVDLAKIIDADIRGSNGVLHVIDRVLSPRRTHFVEWLDRDEHGGKFGRLIRRTRSVMDELEHLSKTNSTVTIFVPDDKAFENFDEDRELPTPERLEYFVRGHIVHDEVPLGTMSPNSTYLLTSESEQPLRVVSKPTAFTVNGVRIVKADDLFADALVHGVDQMLVKPDTISNHERI